jgi:hypothetical protein
MDACRVVSHPMSLPGFYVPALLDDSAVASKPQAGSHEVRVPG